MAQTQRIGVVGGVGPYAGLDLVRKLFDHTRADCDQGHLPVMLLSFPDRIADRPAFLLRGAAVNPGEAIGEIPVGHANEWKTFQAEIAVPDGVQALYFTYRGPGISNLASFSLETE